MKANEGGQMVELERFSLENECWLRGRMEEQKKERRWVMAKKS